MIKGSAATAMFEPKVSKAIAKHTVTNIGYNYCQLVIKDNLNKASQFDLLRVAHSISQYAGLSFSQEDQFDKPNHAFERGEQNRIHLHIILKRNKNVNADYFTKWFKQTKFYNFRQDYDINNRCMLIDTEINTKSWTVHFEDIQDENHHKQTLTYLGKEQSAYSKASIVDFLD